MLYLFYSRIKNNKSIFLFRHSFLINVVCWLVFPNFQWHIYERQLALVKETRRWPITAGVPVQASAGELRPVTMPCSHITFVAGPCTE